MYKVGWPKVVVVGSQMRSENCFLNFTSKITTWLTSRLTELGQVLVDF